MSEEIDMLSSLETADFTNVETGMPTIPKGLYEVEVLTATIDRNKKQTGSNANFKFGLTQPTTAEDGKAVNPGFPVFHVISLVKTDKYDPLQNIARFMECFTGTKSGKFLPVENFIGMKGNVRIDIDDNPEFGKRNIIKQLVKKA